MIPTGWTLSDVYERHRKILELTQRGLSCTDIAEICKCTPRTVVRVRGDNHATVQVHRPFTAQECAQIEAMLDDGCSYEEIARTVGREGSTIGKKWPGRGWTRNEASQYALWMRWEGRSWMRHDSGWESADD